ncbi:hypothetical protein CI109_105899 [Kwoniella shandongensis]|uniref:Major facilitator superfamily (MFS) profile domain-containing protein n=1 Tax=Kwoniella shandongensis TaxID=1734106 RepID=A0AAJ8LRD4_9TREE
MAEGVTGPVPPPQILGSYISDISEDERRRDRKLRIKLDVIFMTYVTLSYTLKFLDQSNYTYAYVSGMQENLSLYGNELTWMGTIFSIGYILGTIPTQLLLTYIRPSYFLGSVEMVWGVFVLCMAAAKSVHTIYAMRFLIGLFEASSYPGLIAVMAAWYTPKELGKRVAILQSASALGAMWAGYLQAAVFAGLNGTHGLPGWKWGFIVNGAITIPVGLLGYFCIPDSPANTRARWLSSSDIALAKLRMARVGRAPARGLSKRTLVKVFTTWPLYAFILPYGLWVINGQAIGFFSLWLKSTKRFLFGVFGSIVLTIWNVSFGLHFAGHILIFATIGGSALILTWVSEVAGGDAEARILIVAILNTFAYVLNAALPSPHYKYGYQISLGFWLVAIAMIVYIGVFLRKRPSPFTQEDETLTPDSQSYDEDSKETTVDRVQRLSTV